MKKDHVFILLAALVLYLLSLVGNGMVQAMDAWVLWVFNKQPGDPRVMVVEGILMTVVMWVLFRPNSWLIDKVGKLVAGAGEYKAVK